MESSRTCLQCVTSLGDINQVQGPRAGKGKTIEEKRTRGSSGPVAEQELTASFGACLGAEPAPGNSQGEKTRLIDGLTESREKRAVPCSDKVKVDGVAVVAKASI